MPYLGRTPAGEEQNILTGDLTVTGAISADVVHESIILNGTDGSSSNANDNVVMNGTDSSSTDADDRLIYEEETANQSTNTQLITDQQTDIRLAFLQLAENSGDRLNFKYGIADPFKDETDIDTSTSTNETYDSTGDFYSATTGTEAAFTSDQSVDSFGNANTNLKSHGLRFTSGDGGTVLSGRCNAGTVTTAVAVTMSVWSENSGSPGSQIGGGSDELAISTTGTKTLTWSSNYPVLEASTLYWIVITDSTAAGNVGMMRRSSNTGFIHGGHDTITSITSGSPSVNTSFPIQLELTTAGTADVTLVSNAFTATSVPATGRIHIQVNVLEVITINTDLTAEISRDGGTTFTEATLVLKETLKDGTEAYEDNNVNISGQPSGSQMKYRIKTLNSKGIQIHGAVLQWA